MLQQLPKVSSKYRTDYICQRAANIISFKLINSISKKFDKEIIAKDNELKETQLLKFDQNNYNIHKDNLDDLTIQIFPFECKMPFKDESEVSPNNVQDKRDTYNDRHSRLGYYTQVGMYRKKSNTSIKGDCADQCTSEELSRTLFRNKKNNYNRKNIKTITDTDFQNVHSVTSIVKPRTNQCEQSKLNKSNRNAIVENIITVDVDNDIEDINDNRNLTNIDSQQKEDYATTNDNDELIVTIVDCGKLDSIEIDNKGSDTFDDTEDVSIYSTNTLRSLAVDNTNSRPVSTNYRPQSLVSRCQSRCLHAEKVFLTLKRNARNNCCQSHRRNVTRALYYPIQKTCEYSCVSDCYNYSRGKCNYAKKHRDSCCHHRKVPFY